MAGLRERLAGESASLAVVEAWLDEEGAVRLADEIPRLELDRRIDELVTLADDAHDERVDGAFTLDELSAGLTFCGSQARVAPFIDLLGRAIRATPAPWCALSPLASQILRRAPPVDDDPAGAMWRTIETTPWVQESLALAGVSLVLPRIGEPTPRDAAQAAPHLPSKPTKLKVHFGEAAELTYAHTDDQRELFLEVLHAAPIG